MAKGTDVRLTQWYLEPKELSGQFTKPIFSDEFDRQSLSSEWEWLNPRGDCNYELNKEPSWLEIQAASGCKLNDGKFDAPRLLQKLTGEFAIETKISHATGDMPAVGGILIWKDEGNFMRFEKGMYGENQIGLSANVEGEWEYFGRGMIISETIYLRMERIGDTFSAYCSSDGKHWMTCGMVNFPTEDSILVGIHAIGMVERWTEMSTATRFDYFRVLK